MIRVATRADVPEILKIYAPYVENTTYSFEYEAPTLEAFRARFLGITKQFPWLVWEESGVILGYAYAGSFKQRAAYDWSVETSIYVSKDARGRGIGKRLLDSLEDR